MKALFLSGSDVLAVLFGQKQWLLERTHSEFRGKIAIIDRNDKQVYGIVTLKDSKGPISKEELLREQPKHLVRSDILLSSDLVGRQIAWVLADPILFRKPLPAQSQPRTRSLFDVSPALQKRIEVAGRNAVLPDEELQIIQPVGRSPARSIAPTKGLIIASPHIDAILSGDKCWEMRKSRTTQRGAIALIKKGTKTIVGVVQLVNSLGPFSRDEMIANETKHLMSPARVDEKADYRYAWVLEDVRRLCSAVPYLHSNQQMWVKLPTDVVTAITRQL